jgi:hypothetical protein
MVMKEKRVLKKAVNTWISCECVGFSKRTAAWRRQSVRGMQFGTVERHDKINCLFHHQEKSVFK